MASEKVFQKNIEIWSHTQPREATLLPYADCSHLAFGETKLGELNLCEKRDGGLVCFHATQGAAKEADEWFNALNLEGVQVIYVYGVGLGYYYDSAVKWLKKNKNHFLVFLEDDIAVIHRLLETDQGTRLLQDPQVRLLYFQNLKEKQEALEAFYWNAAMANPLTTALKHYAETKGETLSELRHKMAFDHSSKNSLVDEYLRYGGRYFLNFYQNMLDLPGAYLGDKLFGKFQGIPAIVCGAGPSLEKNIGQLKNFEGRALIFAGGSAVNLLNNAGLQPHFGASIDPNPAQHFRMSTTSAYEVPYFYRNRIFPGALRFIHGPHLYITGSGGYDISEYFENILGIHSEEIIDEGHSVISFCVDIARALGCNPIIFVGEDLAYTNKKAYAEGFPLDADLDKDTIKAFEGMEREALIEKDIFGRPVYTLWKWVAESQWIGEYAKSHPEIELINCTEGGLGFPGIVNQPLAETAKNKMVKLYDLRNRIHAEIQNGAMPHVTQEKVEAAMQALSASLQRCMDFFDILIEEAERLENLIKKDKSTSPQLQSGRAALAETDMAEEPGYRFVIAVFNEVYSRMLNRELVELRLNAARKNEWRKNIQRIALNRRRLLFLRNVAKVNIELIRHAFKESQKA